MERIIIDIQAAKSKWTPVVENTLRKRSLNFDAELVGDIAVYMEWCGRKHENLGSLADYLKEVYEKIKNTDLRVKIVGEYYNQITGQIDILLEDGRYLQKGSSPMLTIDTYMIIFPEEFLQFYKPEEYRNWKIDQVL